MNETTGTACDVSSPPTTPPKVRFRADRFDAFAKALGYHSTTDKARFVGCGTATMSRILTGKQNPGPAFITAIYTTASRHGVDGADFFNFSGTGD
jgi:hypothetical protein